MSAGIPTRLVQLTHSDEGRRAALVYNDQLHLLATYRSLYSFALAALDTGLPLRDLLSTDLSGIVLDYEEVHGLKTPWRFAACFDHPEEPGRCLVSSAGPPWRYLGSAASLRGHGDSLPASGVPDLAAVYVIARDGLPRRIGIAQGNRGRVSALGPELVLDPGLSRIHGRAEGSTGLQEVAADVPLLLALASIEPDHFDAADYRRPGDVHVLFFGERLFGPVSPLESAEGEQVTIEFDGLGRRLANTIWREQHARRVAAVPL